MKKTTFQILIRLSIFLLATLFSSCTKIPGSITVINSVTREEKKVGIEEKKNLEKYADNSGNIALERLFHSLGYQTINQVSFINLDGSENKYFWNEIASGTKWLANGSILIKKESIQPKEIIVEPSPQATPIEFSILDLAPTVLSSLSLPGNPETKTPALFSKEATHVVLILLDAFGYLDVRKAEQQGLIPNLLGLSKPILGLSVYPPVTSVVTAALITGVEPEVNGVDLSGIRSTKTMTLFDQLRNNQKQFTVIEGNSLYLANLKAEDLILSNDDNQNGTNDDEVFKNAISKIHQKMPDFLWVHFHGLDDTGHANGSWTPEYIKRVKSIDEYIQQIVDACPNDTLFLLTADHGMHTGIEGQRSGEHGNLIAEDMLIPLFIYLKP
jgi:hypothetical protein